MEGEELREYIRIHPEEWKQYCVDQDIHIINKFIGEIDDSIKKLEETQFNSWYETHVQHVLDAVKLHITPACPPRVAAAWENLKLYVQRHGWQGREYGVVILKEFRSVWEDRLLELKQ